MRRLNEWKSCSMKNPNAFGLDRHANQLASLGRLQNQIGRKRVKLYA